MRKNKILAVLNRTYTCEGLRVGVCHESQENFSVDRKFPGEVLLFGLLSIPNLLLKKSEGIGAEGIGQVEDPFAVDLRRFGIRIPLARKVRSDSFGVCPVVEQLHESTDAGRVILLEVNALDVHTLEALLLAQEDSFAESSTAVELRRHFVSHLETSCILVSSRRKKLVVQKGR